jgi:outer membrane lipoprotein-sorting protein
MTLLTRRTALKLSIGGLVLATAPAWAALTPEEAESVSKAQRYLNGISTLQSRFVQISSNGAYAEGEVFIRRPGRMRFEYDPPHPVLLIADGKTLLYYDKELKQSSFIPLWETPLWFLIRQTVEISDDIEVSDIIEADGTLRMTLREKGGGEQGAVTLVFSDRPFELRKWEVIDAQGITTQVALINPDFGVEVDDAVFDYSDLDVHGVLKGRDTP